MGREAPKERRDHLFGLVRQMTRQGPQGEIETQAEVAHLTRIAGLSRASYYRWLEPKLSLVEDADLRDQIQKLALQRRHEGYRRITRRLKNLGLVVNAKRVLRLMRTDNLLSLRKKPFVPRTTDSRHPFPIAVNLIKGLAPTGINQVWVADITYVRLGEAHVYLAVVLDAYSRKAVGWALEDYIDARLPLAALDMAIAERDPPPDLIHHSDRGVQYACAQYAARLADRQIQRSMSRPGNPYENAKAESFMKTLKSEEVDGRAYADLEEARNSIRTFLEEIYNTDRLHSALDYKSPVDFENTLTTPASARIHEPAALSPK
jgi:transposase InsO family protein